MNKYPYKYTTGIGEVTITFSDNRLYKIAKTLFSDRGYGGWIVINKEKIIIRNKNYINLARILTKIYRKYVDYIDGIYDPKIIYFQNTPPEDISFELLDKQIQYILDGIKMQKYILLN